ncbi:MAG: pyrroline-5-carboxylate reductase [Pseudomonadota bacterium]|nr:pyrroline-5-carboxylate reductase [Pseudomonadota bacterium]
MKTTTIAFIGGGNMARSLIGGLIADGCDPQSIWVADPDPAKLRALHEQFAVATTADNRQAAARAGVVVLAVKPQVLHEAAGGLAATVRQQRPLVVSIAAGVREPDLRRWLGGETPLVRAMPNTPALVGSGATALFANPWVSPVQRQTAESILRAVGLTIWVEDEALLDAVTALSGSGPAYFFLVMEALEQAGLDLGLNPQTARLLTLQTAFGAAKMALESSDSSAVLRQRVTSPGGTTERAVAVLRQGGLEALFGQALQAACQRSRELGDLLGEKQ